MMGTGDVSRETLARLGVLLDLVVQWNGTVNLVSTASLECGWDRHVGDSLRMLPEIPPQGRAADMGSGAGFPGLVLAIASGVEFTLFEADRRKASFLREAIRITAAPALVASGRVEAYTGPRFDVITARAFAPLDRLMKLAAPMLAPNGQYLLLKGRTLAQEIEQARLSFAFCAEVVREKLDQTGSVVRIRNIERRHA